MLTRYGVPLLVWFDELVLPEAHRQLDRLGDYLQGWRALLDT